MNYLTINIPIILTLMRIVLIPMMFVSYYYFDSPISNWTTVTIYFLASITDWFDGYLARKLNQTSALGAFLDPVADKIIVSVALLMLVGNNAITETYSDWIFVIPVSIIISREITISALREWMAEIGRRAEVKVLFIAKVKTAAQMLSIGFLFYEHSINTPLGVFPVSNIGLTLLYFAAILTVWSMLVYLKASIRVLRSSNPNKPKKS